MAGMSAAIPNLKGETRAMLSALIIALPASVRPLTRFSSTSVIVIPHAMRQLDHTPAAWLFLASTNHRFRQSHRACRA
jgi:hypothetical protein